MLEYWQRNVYKKRSISSFMDTNPNLPSREKNEIMKAEELQNMGFNKIEEGDS